MPPLTVDSPADPADDDGIMPDSQNLAVYASNQELLHLNARLEQRLQTCTEQLDAAFVQSDCVDFDLYELIEQRQRVWQPRVEMQHLHWLLDVDDHTPRLLRGDARRLTRVLDTLLGNALSYTRTGTIALSIDPMGMSFDEATQDIMLRLVIQDTGMGMSPETLEQLQQELLSTAHEVTELAQHSAMGLASVKQLVALLQGDISVASQLDQGTCFTVILPFGQGQSNLDTPVTTTADAPAAQKHILVVDDNAINRKVAIAIVERLGFKTSEANDGREAVQRIQSESFDLVMMDYHMPILDGSEATRSIRTWETSNKRTPITIIAVSASAFQEDRAHCAAAGMNDFLAKPITLASVQQILGKWLGDARTAITSTSAATTIEPALSQLLPRAHFNHEQFMEMRLLADHMLPTLLQRYLQDAARQIEVIQRAAACSDAGLLKQGAHKLKGASVSIGACVLAELCDVIERNARDQRLDNISTQVQKATEEFTPVSQALTAYLLQLTTDHPA